MLHELTEKKRNVPKTAREYTGTEMITSLKEKEEIFQKQEEDKMERQKLRQKKKEEKEKALENKETNKGSSIPKKRKRTGVQNESPHRFPCCQWQLH